MLDQNPNTVPVASTSTAALSYLPKVDYTIGSNPAEDCVADLNGDGKPDLVVENSASNTVSVLIGNGDAHAKNLSLLHEASGALTLAPLYDLMCTLHYGDDRLAMYIDDVRRTNRVTIERLANEAVYWGISRERATATIDGLLAQAPAAIAAARAETRGVPKEMISVVERQLKHLRSTG